MSRPKHSAYMQWAKTRSQARFNLATSGLTSVALGDFPFEVEQLEITSPGGYGYEPLRQRLSRHTGAPEDCIVTAAGTSMANHLAMAAVIDPGDEVLIEQPTYSLLLETAQYLGAKIKRLPRKAERDFGVDVDELKDAVTPATRLIVLTNLHNPTGALIPAESVRAMGEIALGAGAHVLVDEVYLEMLFDDDAPQAFGIGAMFAGAGENPFIVTSSLTKTYGLSGLRCGWILASPELAHRMWRLNDLFAASGAHVAERMSVMALDHLDRFRERAQKLLAENRALLDCFLDSRDDLECFRPPAGTVAFPRLLQGDPEVFFALLRDQYETSVAPGKFFEMPHHFRIGIGGATAELREGLRRVGAALDKLK